MNTGRRGLLTLIYILFLVSGMTGLVYEVVWTRMLVRVFGGTSFAVTTVLASYMAGLALGSYAFGKRIDRGGNPLVLYGLLELGIGVFAVLFPVIILLLNLIYRAVYPGLHDEYYILTAVLFVLCFLVLLIPTIMMGGTLPVLSKFVADRRSELTRRVGGLYATNTFGRMEWQV